MKQLKPYLLWIVAGVLSLIFIILMVAITPTVEDLGEPKDAYEIKGILDKEAKNLQNLAKRARNGDPKSIWDPQSDAHIAQLTSDYLLTKQWLPVINPNVEKYDRQLGQIREDLQERSRVIYTEVSNTLDNREWYVEYEKLTGNLVATMRDAGCLDCTVGTTGATRTAPPTAPTAAAPTIPGGPGTAKPPGIPTNIPGNLSKAPGPGPGAFPGGPGGPGGPPTPGGLPTPGGMSIPGGPGGPGVPPTPGGAGMPGGLPPGAGGGPAAYNPAARNTSLSENADDKELHPATGKMIRDRLGLFTKKEDEYPAPEKHKELTAQFRIAERICAAIAESAADTLPNPLVEGSGGVRMPAAIVDWAWSATTDPLPEPINSNAKPWRLTVTFKGSESALMAALAKIESLDRPILIVLGSSLKSVPSRSGEYQMQGPGGEPAAATAELAVEVLILDFTDMPELLPSKKPEEPAAVPPPAVKPPPRVKAAPAKAADGDE